MSARALCLRKQTPRGHRGMSEKRRYRKSRGLLDQFGSLRAQRARGARWRKHNPPLSETQTADYVFNLPGNAEQLLQLLHRAVRCRQNRQAGGFRNQRRRRRHAVLRQRNQVAVAQIA